MEIISDNPFRVLGIPVTATDRQISKRVDDLSMFCEMGKTKQYDTDFPFISPLVRTPESIQRAASQVEIPERKLFHSIFWFSPGNSVDELVFNLLKGGNALKGRELWKKSMGIGKLTAKNLSNFRNLSLLNIVLSAGAGRDNLDMFLDAVGGVVKSINHDSFREFATAVGGPGCKFNVEEIQKSFADEVLKTIGAIDGLEHGVTARRYIAAFEGSTGRTVQYVRGKFSSEPVRRLESAIQECQEVRQDDTSAIYAAARSLYATAKGILDNLGEILTTQDVHYQSIADKVANELLRCSTDHFNAAIKVDNGSAPIDQAEELTLLAKEMAAGSSVKARVDDDLVQIEGIRKQIRIRELGDQIVELMTTLPTPDSITEVQLERLPRTLRTFVSESKHVLNSIEHLGGAEHETFLACSELLASIVLGLSILYANKTNEFGAVVGLLQEIETLEMSAALRMRFDLNQGILRKNLTAQQALPPLRLDPEFAKGINAIVEKYSVQTRKDSGGCYIATLVYGSYEAPEVLVLRQFRDEVLSRTFCGRLFIRLYYAVSPSLVALLDDRTTIHRLIRKLLDRLIEKVT